MQFAHTFLWAFKMQSVFQKFLTCALILHYVVIPNQHGSCRFIKISASNFVLISISGMYLFYLLWSRLYNSGLCSGCFMRLYSLLNLLKHILYNQQCQTIAFRDKR